MISAHEQAMRDMLRRGSNGALAGALATVPMSAVMLGAERAGLMGRQPPEVIAQKALAAANQEPGKGAVHATAVAAHFGFGAAAGAAFAWLNGDENSGPRLVANGLAFGLAVYAVSYAGWIPAMGILPAPSHDRQGRQPSMAAAHAVYGIALALLLRSQRDR